MREATLKTVSDSQALIQSAEKYFPNRGGSFKEEKKKNYWKVISKVQSL